MHAPVLLVGSDAAGLRRVRDDFISGGLLNPVRACTDGQEAAAYVLGHGDYAYRDLHPLPAVVVTELRLPVGDGVDLLRAVRSTPATRRTPVIVTGIDADEADIATLHELGVTAYLSHHVAQQALLEVIRGLSVPWSLGRVEAGT